MSSSKLPRSMNRYDAWQAVFEAERMQSVGRPEEAIALLREAVQLYPQVARVHVALASALVDVGAFDESFGHYREAVRLDPEPQSSYLELGQKFARHGRMAEALSFYEADVGAGQRVSTLSALSQDPMERFLQQWTGASRHTRECQLIEVLGGTSDIISLELLSLTPGDLIRQLGVCESLLWDMGLSGDCIRRRMRLLRQFLRFCQGLGILPTNHQELNSQLVS